MSKNSLEEEVRDKIYRLKLKMLKERMYKTDPYPYYDDAKLYHRQTEVGPLKIKNKPDQKMKMKQIVKELEEGRNKYEKIKLKLKQQEMEKGITSSIIQLMNRNDKPQVDNSSKFMEMMMLQQNQTQNLVMNQLMLKIQQDKPQYNFSPYIQNPYSLPPVKPSSPNINSPVVTIDPIIATPLISKPLPQINKKDNVSQPFPGNDAQRSVRRLGLATVFCSILEDNFQEQLLYLSDKFLFEVKIKEIINTIEKYYTNPGGEIFKLLNTLLLNESPNFKILISRTGTNEELTNAEKELNFVLQNIAAKIAEIMPSNGTLGCECKSILSEFIQNKQRFPEKYFFNSEKNLLQVDTNDTVHKVGFIESQLLLIGMFIVRTMVMHILMKSVEYNLCSSLTSNGQDNLRILASLFVIVYQTILVEFITQKYPNEVKIRTINIQLTELSNSIMTESELQPILKVVKKSMDYVKTVILKWSETYVMKLRPI